MDELVLCEVSVKESSIDGDVKPDLIITNSAICGNASKAELIVPDFVTPASGSKHITVKKEKDEFNLDPYSKDVVLPHEEKITIKEERVSFLDSDFSESDSQLSEAELKPQKSSQSEYSILASYLNPNKRRKLQEDLYPRPGTSIQPTMRERESRIGKAESSSTSVGSQDNPNDSDFGLHGSEDSSGFGPYGSLEGYRLGEGASRFSVTKTETFASSDELLYCVDCKCAYEGDCPEHGPLLVVYDTVVPSNAGDNTRAARTAPPEVKIDGPRRVVSVLLIPNRTRFGPLQGKMSPSEVVNEFTRPIYKYGRHIRSLDSSDPAISNWMRFVRRTEDDIERNLDAYQFKGQIFFRTIREILPGEELVVGNGTSQGLFTQYLRNESYVTERHDDGDDRFEELQDAPSCSRISDDELSRQTSEECSLVIKSSKEKPLRQKGRKGRRPRLNVSENSPNIVTKIYFVCCGCSETFARKQTMLAEKLSHNDDVSFDRTLQGSNGEVPHLGKESNERRCSNRLTGDESNNGDRSNGNLKEGTLEELLVCSECSQVFGKKVTLSVNVRNQTDEKSKDCENRLGWAYPDEKSSDGDSRLSRTRSEARPKTNNAQKRVNVCPVCSEQFIGKRPLNKHMRTHINQKPYVCPHCSQGFARKFTLNMHIRTHTREKPYECPQCNKCFAISVNLRTHMKIHAGVKPYVCTECNRSFARKSHLDGHMQIHNGEKTFVCPSCGHKFFHKHNLIKHMRTHSKEQPFGCPECNERFAYKSHFKKHLRIHTGGAAWTGPIIKDQQVGQT